MLKKIFTVALVICCLLVCMPMSFAAEDAVLKSYASYVDGNFEELMPQLDEMMKGGDEFAEMLLGFGATTTVAFQQAYFNYFGRDHFPGLTERMKELYAGGNLVAGMTLGYIYHYGYMTEASEETARGYFDPTEEALVALAEKSPELQQEGRFDITEFGSKATEIETGMTVKNPLVCSYIALCYQAGVGGAEVDYQKAAGWYLEASRYGVPYALDIYDLMVSRGQADATLTEYRNNLELLTERFGYSDSAYQLAVLEFYCGEIDEARETLKLAADLGNQRAKETTMLSDYPIIYDGELSELFARLEQREAEIEAVRTGIPLVHEALNGDRTIYVVDLNEGDALTAIFTVLMVSAENDDFGADADLPIFRFLNPIENCLFFSVPFKIIAEDNSDFSEVEWRTIAYLPEENGWAGGAPYDYIDDTCADAVIAFDEPTTIGAVSVVPVVAPNGYGAFNVEAGFTQALIGFPDQASAQAFAQRFKKE